MTCKEPKRIMRKASRGGCKPGAQAIRQPCNEFPARSRAFDPRYGLQEGALAHSGARQPEWYRESTSVRPRTAGVFIYPKNGYHLK